jgi:hypothetical protein
MTRNKVLFEDTPTKDDVRRDDCSLQLSEYERGVRFGRKPKFTAHQIAEALARRQAGEALTEIGRSYNVSHSISGCASSRHVSSLS